MPIKIHNSLTREKEELIPLQPGKLNIYTCGVTVYDDCHIGHARSLYIFDLIRRYLSYRGFKVNFIRNITDIDDKIINRANELKIDWRELVGKYIESYYQDLESLGIENADDEPMATQNIPDMIKFIQGLFQNGYAYESGGDVYFNVRKFPDYGKLSGQSIDQMETAVRISASEIKHDPLDFALWKKSKQSEPSWDSPWGPGRPGWHIECSVMSAKYSKADTLDIHAGGRDLIFPHHENEIAQSEALTGKRFAKYWMHHGLLTINSQKMAKSAGNFITIKDIISKYPADILKLFYLQAHYSSPIDFSWDKMEEVKKAYEHLDILVQKLEKGFASEDIKEIGGEASGSLKEYRGKFIEYMDDDFNTPRALSVLFDVVKKTNQLLDSDIEFKNSILRYALDVINEMAAILGLNFLKPSVSKSGMADEEIERMVNARLKFKAEKKFSESDKIRKELEANGIILEDSKAGTTWRRKL